MTESQLRTVADHDEIRQILYRYCRALDRCDAELLASVYHPDANHVQGAFTGAASDFVEYAMRVAKGYELTNHSLGNILIDVHEDIADVESYVVVREIVGPENDGQRLITEVVARYVDRFERRNGRWRIASRVCHEDWRETREINIVVRPRDLKASRRDREDISYQGKFINLHDA
jgi:hypothetical protein